MTIPQDRQDALNAGAAAAANLAETLVVDFGALLRAPLPDHAAVWDAEAPKLAKLGISARMTATGRLLLDHLGPSLINELGSHPSDTVRGWACFMIGAQDLPLAARLDAIRAYADDGHFGVREWAWLAVRPAVADEIETALALLSGWTSDPSERVRRFASEATRPRGVWCKHIGLLKTDPAPGLAVLAPLRADVSPYVQDSVANWLNDAAKTRPDWVRSVVADWLAHAPPPETRRIAKRALRSIDKEQGTA